jgi:hypothetical protein
MPSPGLCEPREMLPSAARHEQFPDWLRWGALLWLVLWLPVYGHTWGAANFLHLCDIAVILTCIALWGNNALLISSQAVSSLVIDAVWALDAGSAFFLGHHVIGGTEYLFDERYPLWVRILSLFHLVMPPLLLWALYWIGYDRSGFAAQSVIAVLAFIGARFASPARNLNFVFTDPFFHRSWGPAPVHVVLSFLCLVFVVYLPTHLLLEKLFSPDPPDLKPL